MMVGSSGGKTIVTSGKWPCSICGKGVQANSVLCTVCRKMDSHLKISMILYAEVEQLFYLYLLL